MQFDMSFMAEGHVNQGVAVLGAFKGARQRARELRNSSVDHQLPTDLGKEAKCQNKSSNSTNVSLFITGEKYAYFQRNAKIDHL
jgi:hypothetical protein